MLSAQADISSLDGLCRVLNGCQPSLGTLSPETNLPTFGGVAPPNLAGIWSWDATRVLFSGRDGQFFIEPRDPEIWYPNEKAFPLP
jgi:hypothetical protein